MSVIKGVIFGPPGIGKTTLVKSLPVEDTLFIDLEAGKAAIQDWIDAGGKHLNMRTWDSARCVAGCLGGIDPKVDNDKHYGKIFYDMSCARFKSHCDFGKYKTVIIDSISVASHLCKAWCAKQPEAFTEKGASNMLKMYGLLADELIAWFNQLQHSVTHNIWLIGQLGSKEIPNYAPEPVILLEGGKAGTTLPYIFDEILAMINLKTKDKEGKDTTQRVLVSNALNIWGYKVKDRSGALNSFEPANLGYIMKKISEGQKKNTIFNESPIEEDAILY